MNLALWIGPAAAAVVLVAALVMAARKHHCPKCGTAFPRIRRPADQHEALWGGGTCRTCGTKVDSSGRLRTDASNDSGGLA